MVLKFFSMSYLAAFCSISDQHRVAILDKCRR